MFTQAQLHLVLPEAGGHADDQYPFLNQYMADYAIGKTLYDSAAFIATIGHESMQLTHTTELGGVEYFTGLYEGRTDLGNTEPGDGARYRGRGDIQDTGRWHYRDLTARLRARYGAEMPDFEAEPEKLALPQYAALSACDFWYENGLTAIANQPNFWAVTHVVNGGYNGWDNRNLLYTRALRIFSS